MFLIKKMIPVMNVFLYSKYSPVSKQLFEFINQLKSIKKIVGSKKKIISRKEKQNSIKVNTVKAEGQKCPVCWKINKNGCERDSCSNKS